MGDWSLWGLDLTPYLTAKTIGTVIRIGALLFLGIPLVYWASRQVRSYTAKRYTPQHGLIFGKIIFYSGLVTIAISILRQLGLPLTHLLGAAGVAGIAIGFASQTSVSNIISGLFLVAERPFLVNDVIAVGDITGQVLSIDTLSVKIRTFDNKFVRIPNETIIKSQTTTITRFPIRRVDVNVGVAYKEDMGRVRAVLMDIAHKNPLCLEQPEPLVIFTGFGNSSIDMLFAVWAAKADWLAVKNGLMEQIKRRFDEEGIEIPFPHLSLYTGLATEPFPIAIVDRSSSASLPAAPQASES